MTAVVAVGTDPPAGRRRWIRALSPHLPGTNVVDLADLDPSAVEILVVGNPPGETLAHLSALRFVQSTWAGVDALLQGAPEAPIARLVAAPLTERMTEFVLTAVLMLHRDLPAYRRLQGREEWSPLPVVAAGERAVGVLGFGELGRPAALRLAEAGFDVVSLANKAAGDGPVPVVAGEQGWRRVLERSRILVNLLSLTPSTRGIIDRRAFDLMPVGAALVNAARGAHVVEADLLEALDSGRLADAVLDVFEREPLCPGHPFWAHPRVTVLPHVAAPSEPEALAGAIAANIRRFLEGEPPRHLVER